MINKDHKEIEDKIAKLEERIAKLEQMLSQQENIKEYVKLSGIEDVLKNVPTITY